MKSETIRVVVISALLTGTFAAMIPTSFGAATAEKCGDFATKCRAYLSEEGDDAVSTCSNDRDNAGECNKSWKENFGDNINKYTREGCESGGEKCKQAKLE